MNLNDALYIAGEEVMVYHWIGETLKRKVCFGFAIATGNMRFVDNGVYYEVDLQDGLGTEYIHEDNLESWDIWIKRDGESEDGFMVEELD